MVLGILLGLVAGVVVILIANPRVAEDIETATLATRQPWYLAGALLALAVLLVADAWSLVLMVRVIRPDVSRAKTFGVSFEANLVGGATMFGGLEIPYQVFVLYRIGLKPSESTSAVLVKGVIHTSVLVLVALAAFLPIAGSPITPLQRWIILGVIGGLMLAWVVGYLWLRRPLGLSLLPARLGRRLRAFVDAMAVFRQAGWRVMVQVVLWQLVYWAAMFAIIPLVLHALGWRGSIMPVMTGQAVLQVLMPLSPLPGGAGIAEFGYLELIGSNTPERIRVASLILWRVLTWLIPMALGAVALGIRTAGYSRRSRRPRPE
jgi:hypothetical protein